LTIYYNRGNVMLKKIITMNKDKAKKLEIESVDK